MILTIIITIGFIFIIISMCIISTIIKMKPCFVPATPVSGLSLQMQLRWQGSWNSYSCQFLNSWSQVFEKWLSHIPVLLQLDGRLPGCKSGGWKIDRTSGGFFNWPREKHIHEKTFLYLAINFFRYFNEPIEKRIRAKT